MLAEHTRSRLLDLAAVDMAEIAPNDRATGRCSIDSSSHAGSDEPLSHIIRDFMLDDGGKSAATIVVVPGGGPS